MASTSVGGRGRNDVPYRTIVATIGLVVATYLSWLILKQIVNILQLIAVAAFFALALNPAVDFCQRKLRLRRGYAITLVIIVGIVLMTCLLYLFIRPIAEQTNAFIRNFPETVEDARNGKGQIGRLVERYDLDAEVAEAQPRIQEFVTRSSGSFGSVLGVVGTVIGTVFALLTILVLTILMLVEGPAMVRTPLVFFDEKTQGRISKVASDGARSITGYVAGNAAISVIAGTVTFITLTVLGVPSAIVLAVFVAFADMIPLVGATLGAVPTIFVAFLHSTKAGIVSVIVYVIYQQVENHVLQPTIMARTVRLNPLMVIISVLIGARVLGLLGALLAIPLAGVIQVIGRDLYDQHSGRLKGAPTIGQGQIPVDQVEPGSLEKKDGID